MKIVQSGQFTCVACGKSFGEADVAAGPAVRNAVADLIRRDHPLWSTTSRICREDLARYSMEYIESLLTLERGELTSLGKEALKSLQQHGLLAANVEAAFEKDWTLGRRLADRLVKIGAHRMFSLWFGVFMVASILTSAAAMYWRPANPYPIILVNLVLVCFAAIQAPIIGLSQAPHSAKDRLRSEHNYLMGLKAELGIRQLNSTVEDLARHQRQLVEELQQTILLVMAQSGKADALPQAQQRPVKSA